MTVSFINKLYFTACATVVTLAVLFLVSCMPAQGIGVATATGKPEWTILMYMASDNDLEGSALRTINELEAGLALVSGIQVLALIDRSSGHDASDGNWSDTRVLAIRSQTGPPDSVIVSNRISCPPLGIPADSFTELDLTDARILELFIEWAQTEYPSNKTALIIWGHADGWRTLLFDEDTDKQMTMSSLARVTGTANLDLIGFDMSFGATLEYLYELAGDSAKPPVVLASAGMVPSDGWNYYTVFSHLAKEGRNLDPEQFAHAVISACTETWSADTYGPAAFRLDKTGAVFTAFEQFARELSALVTSRTARDAVRSLLLYEVLHHDADSWPCDRFIELEDLAKKVRDTARDLAPTEEEALRLIHSAETLTEALNAATIAWRTGRMSVQLIPLEAPDLPGVFHSPWYTRGSAFSDQPRFVKDSQWWVPAQPVSDSLLDRLFYTSW